MRAAQRETTSPRHPGVPWRRQFLRSVRECARKEATPSRQCGCTRAAEGQAAKLQTLTSQGAQLIEVLPADDYEWAHLPGAVNHPLKELDARTGQLDGARPVIVYCHDWYRDMSPRAAWRFEEAGFGPVYDYAAGKGDCLAADLPFEGTARLAGMFTRRGVATVAERAPAAEALRLLDAQGFGRSWLSNAWGGHGRGLPRRPGIRPGRD
ncbi:MAG: rhodanese-like domain-containing protein [Streptosporangiaceae bacterium]